MDRAGVRGVLAVLHRGSLPGGVACSSRSQEVRHSILVPRSLVHLAGQGYAFLGKPRLNPSMISMLTASPVVFRGAGWTPASPVWRRCWSSCRRSHGSKVDLARASLRGVLGIPPLRHWCFCFVTLGSSDLQACASAEQCVVHSNSLTASYIAYRRIIFRVQEALIMAGKG